MKKVITALLVALVCASIFSASACAESYAGKEDYYVYYEKYESAAIQFEDDFSKLYLDGKSYTKVNDRRLNMSNEYEWIYIDTFFLTEEQLKKVSSVDLNIALDGKAVDASYTLADGGEISHTYLADKYIQEYNSTINDEWVNAKAVIYEGAVVDVSRSLLKGSRIDFYRNEIRMNFDVLVPFGDEDYGVIVGELLVNDDEYYYVDYTENRINSVLDKPTMVAYKITDSQLCAEFDAAMDIYYSSDLGFFEDDDFTEMVSDTFLIIVFAVIPFVIFGLFLFFAIKSKTEYRKIFTVIYALAGAEVIIFVVVATLFNVLK